MLKTRKSFTLIELLVVIAIIGILAAVGITAINSARQKAKVSAGKGKMSSIPAVLSICISAKGSINDPTSSPVPNPNYICSTPSATDIVWPNLSQDGWEWFSITGNDSNDVAVSAGCEAENCGNPQYALITINGIIFSSSPPPTAPVTFTPTESTVTTANAYFTAISNGPFAIIWTISGQEITTSGTKIRFVTCTRSGNTASTSSSVAAISSVFQLISSAVAVTVPHASYSSSVLCSTAKPTVDQFNHVIQASVVGGSTRTWHWILNSPTPTLAPTPTHAPIPTPTPTPPPPE